MSNDEKYEQICNAIDARDENISQQNGGMISSEWLCELSVLR